MMVPCLYQLYHKLAINTFKKFNEHPLVTRPCGATGGWQRADTKAPAAIFDAALPYIVGMCMFYTSLK